MTNLRPLEVPLGSGYGCRGCGLVFTSCTGFDGHQRLTPQGLTHLDPEALGFIRKPNGQWSLPPSSYTRSLASAP